MDDILETPVGEFDWGPTDRGRSLLARPLVHRTLVAIGAALLAIGIALA